MILNKGEVWIEVGYHFLSPFLMNFPRSIGSVGALRIADFREIGTGLFMFFLNSEGAGSGSFLEAMEIFLV